MPNASSVVEVVSQLSAKSMLGLKTDAKTDAQIDAMIVDDAEETEEFSGNLIQVVSMEAHSSDGSFVRTAPASSSSSADFTAPYYASEDSADSLISGGIGGNISSYAYVTTISNGNFSCII